MSMNAGRAPGVLLCQPLTGIVRHRGTNYVKWCEKSKAGALEKRRVACVSV